MSLVHIRFQKWPDQPHWRFSGEHIGDDEFGTWIGGRRGGSARRGSEPETTFKHDWVKLIVPDTWWTAIWNTSGDCYVDIITPPQWEGDVVTMVDLDLDIFQAPNGSVEVMDEDEFLDHQLRFGYPPDLVTGARTATAAVLASVQSGAEPFRSVGPRRLADWVAGTRESSG